MIRYFSTTLAAFACLVALAVAQDNTPVKKKAEPAKEVKNDDAAPGAEKAGVKDAKAEPKKDADDEPEGPPPEDPKVIIERLKGNFEKAQEKLDKGDPGEETRKTQKQIVEDLKKLMEQQDNNKSGGGGGGGGGKANQGDGGGGKANQGDGGGAGQKDQKNPMGLNDKKQAKAGGNDNQKKDDQGNGAGKKDDPNKKKEQGLAKKDDAGNGQSEAKKDDKGGGRGASGIEGKGKEDKKTTLNDLKKDKDIWGHLPEHRRKEMDAFSSERFIPRYEELLRAYYRTIAESGRRKETDP